MPLVWSTKIATKNTIQSFSRRVTEEYDLFGAKPLTKPSPPIGVGARTRNSKCPICDGMELPPAAGGDEVVSTHTVMRE